MTTGILEVETTGEEGTLPLQMPLSWAQSSITLPGQEVEAGALAAVSEEASAGAVLEALAEAHLVEEEQAARGNMNRAINDRGFTMNVNPHFLCFRLPFKSLYNLAYQRVPYYIFLIEIHNPNTLKPFEHLNTLCEA